MPDILMVKQGSFLAPFDAVAEDDVRQLPARPLMVSVRQPRSLPFDRLYRGCLASICKSGGYDKGTDALHSLTKSLAAFVEVDITPTGDAKTRLKSIGHTASDAPAFRQFFDNAVKAWVEFGYYDYLDPKLRAQLEAGER